MGINVPNHIWDICRRYDAVPISALPSRYSQVFTAAGRLHGELVIRCSTGPLAAAQAATLQAMAGLETAPRVHDVMHVRNSVWTVMARVRPGWPLARDTSSISALVAALKPLRNHPAPDGVTMSLTDWLAARLKDDSLADRASGQSVAPTCERTEALRVLRQLSVPKGSEWLCHGDANPGNLLRGASQLWWIDPRGIAGEVEYDVAVMALKTSVDLVALANGVGVDAERVRAWSTVAMAARV